MLATAVVRLKSETGISKPLRALCDTGSQVNMISETAARSTLCPIQKCNVRVNGVNGSKSSPHTRKMTCGLVSRFDNVVVATIDLLIVPEVLGTWLPQIGHRSLKMPRNVEEGLADPAAHVSAPVDVLLGAGVWATIIRNGLISSESGLILQPSSLGWLIFGGIVVTLREMVVASDMVNESESRIDWLLRQFWEIEEVSTTRSRDAEQEQ